VTAAGEATAAGYPVLAVGRDAEMWAEFGVTDVEVGRLTPGMAAEVYVFGPERDFSGKLEEIGALADSQTRVFTARVRLSNPEALLKAGMIARVSILLPAGESVLAPVSSIIHLSGSDIVYVYDSVAGTARQRQVTTGALRGSRVEVLTGLEPGEQLIVEGQYKLRDGVRVNPL
jgi:RND family efflux transporter MFP subunit